MKRRVSVGVRSGGGRHRATETGKEGERNKAVREKLREGQTGERAEGGGGRGLG